MTQTRCLLVDTQRILVGKSPWLVPQMYIVDYTYTHDIQWLQFGQGVANPENTVLVLCIAMIIMWSIGNNYLLWVQLQPIEHVSYKLYL